MDKAEAITIGSFVVATLLSFNDIGLEPQYQYLAVLFFGLIALILTALLSGKKIYFNEDAREMIVQFVVELGNAWQSWKGDIPDAQELAAYRYMMKKIGVDEIEVETKDGRTIVREKNEAVG